MEKDQLVARDQSAILSPTTKNNIEPIFYLCNLGSNYFVFIIIIFQLGPVREAKAASGSC